VNEEQKQKRLKIVAISLGAVALLVVGNFIIRPMFFPKEGSQTPTMPTPETKAKMQAQMQSGGAPTPSAPSGGQPASPAPSGSLPASPAPAAGNAPPAGGAPTPMGPGAAMMGGQTQQQQPPPQDPHQLLISPTTDLETKVTILRMLGQAPAPGKQEVASSRVKVEPKPKISFFDPSSGYGWGAVLRGSQMTPTILTVSVAPPQTAAYTTPSAAAVGPAVPSGPMMGAAPGPPPTTLAAGPAVPAGPMMGAQPGAAGSSDYMMRRRQEQLQAQRSQRRGGED
jgi:hypothetical protein